MARLSNKAKKLLYIEWEDPTTEHAGWFELIPEELDKLSPALVKTVGWIIKETKTNITLCSSLIEGDNMASCDTTIPKKLINKKINLEEKHEKSLTTIERRDQTSQRNQEP